MIKELCLVEKVEQCAHNTFVLTFRSPAISKLILPGQFLNIKSDDGTEPLLRRPFSAYRIVGDSIEVIFNIVGKGTSALRKKQSGDEIDVLGPLGVPFTVGDEFNTSVLIGGGLGVAPLPILTQALRKRGTSITTILGARSANQLVEHHLDNLMIATDDGSKGRKGTVVDLLKDIYPTLKNANVKLFACGPTKMLRALAEFAFDKNIACEVSLEGPMACGFGICQGCPVELNDTDKKYALMCKDGPTFDIRKVRI